MSWRFPLRGRQRAKLQYLAFEDSVARPRAFVDSVLTEQARHATDALISPWLTHGIAPGSGNLDATRSFVTEADQHSLVADRTLLVGVGVTEAIIRGGTTREEFGAELLDWPEHPLYLRVQVTSPESYRQYNDEDVLWGLRSLVEDLVQNDRPVMLPQAGLIGWLMMGFGAKSTGTGISSSLQRFAPSPSSGGGGKAPLSWYFLPQFLGFVQRDEVRLLESIEGFAACPCPYCNDLDFSRRGRWDSDLAGLHYLWWCALLVDEVRTAADPQAVVTSRVGVAEEFWQRAQSAKVVLDSRSTPRHLEAWTAVVAAV